MSMRLTFLGTGTSTGNPEIGCDCEVCRSRDPRDWRTRTSALVETGGRRLLIDCGPDFRWQMLKNHVDHLDGILLTHEHYDHVGGLDDLRPFCREKGMEIYAERNVIEAIKTRLPYVFREHKYPGVPNLIMREIDTRPFEAAGVRVIPIRVMHASLPILGFRIGDMAYLTDIKTLPETEYAKLQGLKVLVLDALRDKPHLSHESVGEALALSARLAPEATYFVHMSHRVGLHAMIERQMPEGVHYAYDGLRIEL